MPSQSKGIETRDEGEEVKIASPKTLIAEERKCQILQWGGAEHDDTHNAPEWISFIQKQLRKAYEARTEDEYQRRMVKINALSLSALESLDRIRKRRGRQ